LITWGWRQGALPLQDYYMQMGFWDMDLELNRIATPLVEEYKNLIAAGYQRVGKLQEELMLERR